MPMKDEDEFRHPSPNPDLGKLWGDTLWVSTVDPAANIFGINHFHLSDQGFGRFEALYIIDGVKQQYGNKFPLTKDPDKGPWTDGVLTYEVVKPQEVIRIKMDGPRFRFDLTYTGRFPMFDYFDHKDNPFANFMGGHNEQGMHCTGEFEICGGPNKGDVRKIDCYSHRDHSWSYRFAEEPAWEWEMAARKAHFWPSFQSDSMHLNVHGLLAPAPPGYPELPGDGSGFVSTKDGGTQHIKEARGQVLLEDDGRTACNFRYEIVLPNDEMIHIRTGRKYGQVKLWDRAENDLENRLDCYEPFFDMEIEETGERGCGVCEYSIYPPVPRWLV
ncbi:MAG: hypothetical protein CMQ19_03795 [Gammaproteobacteria bacterium]|nr:hypothetical protein [Gammaproteobacteria bacterium]|tara:strand:+ start:1145 stop:2131 length:987 start_codon:yes stop_codon:yes gene_type:complete